MAAHPTYPTGEPMLVGDSVQIPHRGEAATGTIYSITTEVIQVHNSESWITASPEEVTRWHPPVTLVVGVPRDLVDRICHIQANHGTAKWSHLVGGDSAATDAAGELLRLVAPVLLAQMEGGE